MLPRRLKYKEYPHEDDRSSAGLSEADRLKLAGIEDGAEVNVNADWNAVSGDAQILNKPTTTGGYGITNIGIGQVEIDFGSTPIEEKDFTITNANIDATSYVIAQVAYKAPTGKELDELEFDTFDFRCVAGSGNFILHAKALEGYVADKFYINYSFHNV